LAISGKILSLGSREYQALYVWEWLAPAVDAVQKKKKKKKRKKATAAMTVLAIRSQGAYCLFHG
jgi:hypothetical protein